MTIYRSVSDEEKTVKLVPLNNHSGGVDLFLEDELGDCQHIATLTSGGELLLMSLNSAVAETLGLELTEDDYIVVAYEGE